MKLKFLLQLTLLLQKERIKESKPIRKYGGPQRDKILRRLKKGRRNDVFGNQSWGLIRLFGYLPRVINFYRQTIVNTLALLTTILFLLKKLLLLSILVICRVLDSLLSQDVNGN
ncbi:MAG: hypothetical protein L0H53_06985 [Candidatus Nitrosocosmicus sp.]|nr:hypothetical protein [Candidatus Nitrosocosmicus sp.]